MKTLAGRVALVTGASRGIGQGIAQALGAAGAKVVVNYRSHAQEAEAVAASIREAGSDALVWQADVADRAAVKRMIDAAVEHFGRLDIAVANAAHSIREPVIEAKWENVLRTIEVTQFGVFHTCQFAAQQMVAQPRQEGTARGKIIVISSIHEELAFPGSAAYNMSKAAINHLVRTMAAETGAEAFVRQTKTIMSRQDSRPLLPKIGCPTLVLVGDADVLTPPELAKEIAAGIHGSRLVIVPDCGHLSTMERPEAVNMALKEWLSA